MLLWISLCSVNIFYFLPESKSLQHLRLCSFHKYLCLLRCLLRISQIRRFSKAYCCCSSAEEFTKQNLPPQIKEWKMLIFFHFGVDYLQFNSVQSLSRVWLFATMWIAARQASLSITNSHSSLRLTSIESVMPSSHLILSSLSPPAPNPSRHQSLFQWVNSSRDYLTLIHNVFSPLM